jgi:hypothetical protein
LLKTQNEELKKENQALREEIKKATGLKKKIVNLMEKQKKSLLDFCYILPKETSRDLSAQGSIPLTKWLLEHSYDPSCFGLVKLNNIKGMYALFYDQTATLGYRGIVKNELSN